MAACASATPAAVQTPSLHAFLVSPCVCFACAFTPHLYFFFFPHPRNIDVPGFSQGQVAPYRRIAPTDAHRARLAAVRKANMALGRAAAAPAAAGGEEAAAARQNGASRSHKRKAPAVAEGEAEAPPAEPAAAAAAAAAGEQQQDEAAGSGSEDEDMPEV